jgi:hypothetical protein
VARWIFLALWGVRMAKGDAAAIQYVTKVFENVVVQPRDAREASDVFYRQKTGEGVAGGALCGKAYCVALWLAAPDSGALQPCALPVGPTPTPGAARHARAARAGPAHHGRAVHEHPSSRRNASGRPTISPRPAPPAGDVLLTYENEVFLTNEIYGDKALPCVVPTHNIRIECPLSPVDKVLEPRGAAAQKAADDFCR